MTKEKMCSYTVLAMIIGFFLYVYVPAFLSSIDQAKLKRTSSDMRNFGSAWLGWLTDEVGAYSAGTQKMYRTQGHVVVSHEELVERLVPEYAVEVPKYDGWRNPLVFTQNQDLLSTSVMAIFSPGKDGVFADEPGPDGEYPVVAFNNVVEEFNHDVIWADGYFVQWAGCFR